jgi:hypothetical protein
MKLSWDASVDVATDYGLDGRGSIPDRGKRFVCAPQSPDRLWGPPNLSSGYRGVKLLGREADYSLPSSAEVKNGGAIPPFPSTSSWLVLNWSSTATTLPFYFTVIINLVLYWEMPEVRLERCPSSRYVAVLLKQDVRHSGEVSAWSSCAAGCWHVILEESRLLVHL